MRVVGEDAKAYGRDVGTHTEGRRNNIESYRYVCMYVTLCAHYLSAIFERFLIIVSM